MPAVNSWHHFRRCITNPAFEAILAAHQLRAAQGQKASKWQPTRTTSEPCLACENTIKPVLKDPRLPPSGEGMSELTDNNVTVFVNYTHQRFGGRLQDTHSCTYTR